MSEKKNKKSFTHSTCSVHLAFRPLLHNKTGKEGGKIIAQGEREKIRSIGWEKVGFIKF